MPTHAISVDGNPANSTTGDAPSSSPYLAYVATLTQTGTGNPVAIVLNSNDANYLGDIAWTREYLGAYKGTLAGAFTADKTFMVIVNSSMDVDTVFSISEDMLPDSVMVSIAKASVFMDGAMYRTPIEIRVYQS